MPDILFSVENLVKEYPDGTRIPSGLSLELFEQECVVIAGSNGSGKTQCMRMLTGLSSFDSGSILYRNQQLDSVLDQLRSEVGLVFQDADSQILGDTVEEDIAFGPVNLGIKGQELENRIQQALTALGLDDKRKNAPRQLSGGEKRRLAVAGVLAMGCKTILMDEPFANLDWHGVIQVLELIKELKNQGKTLVILTHELEKVLAFADRLLILHKGRIYDSGKPETVLNRLKPEYGIRDPRYNYKNVEACTWLP